MNCLIYALRFWANNPTYRIWYNSDHCINIPTSVSNPFPDKEFLPAEEFGYHYFAKWEVMTDPKDIALLQRYFKVIKVYFGYTIEELWISRKQIRTRYKRRDRIVVKKDNEVLNTVYYVFGENLAKAKAIQKCEEFIDELIKQKV